MNNYLPQQKFSLMFWVMKFTSGRFRREAENILKIFDLRERLRPLNLANGIDQ